MISISRRAGGGSPRTSDIAALLEDPGRSGAAYALSNPRSLAFESGETGRTEALQGESLSLYGKLGDMAGRAYALTNLGEVARERGKRSALLHSTKKL